VSGRRAGLRGFYAVHRRRSIQGVGDTLGHSVDDQLLKEAPQRLLRCTRETDTVSWLGGDEFTVLLVDMHDLENEAR
jgi:diguanylate cyclase (GGDEF)-like protein